MTAAITYKCGSCRRWTTSHPEPGAEPSATLDNRLCLECWIGIHDLAKAGSKKGKPDQRRIYLMRQGPLFKVGIAGDPEKRRKDIEHASGKPTELLYSTPSQYASTVEAALHDVFNYRRKIGEWFDLDPYEAAQIIWWMRNPEALA